MESKLFFLLVIVISIIGLFPELHGLVTKFGRWLPGIAGGVICATIAYCVFRHVSTNVAVTATVVAAVIGFAIVQTGLLRWAWHKAWSILTWAGRIVLVGVLVLTAIAVFVLI